MSNMPGWMQGAEPLPPTTPTPPPKTPIWKRRPFNFILSFFGLCFFCTALSLIWSVTPSGRAYSATQTAEVAAVELAAKATRNAPTNTPEPPTATPEPSPTSPPTNTPEPTATAEPTATTDPVAADEATYAAFLGPALTELGEVLTEFGELNTAAGEDSSLLFDNDWRRNVALSTVLIEDVSQRIVAYNGPVPPRFASIHERLVGVAGDYDRSMDMYRQGLDNGDMALFNESVEVFTGASQVLQEVSLEIQAMFP